MSQTTFIQRASSVVTKPFPECHDGIGSILWSNVLSPKQHGDKQLHFFHDDILPPGTSIGIHTHERDEEYYYILAGTGIMTLDDETFPVSAGDITAVFPGGSHGLMNNGQADLRVLVVNIRR